MVGATKEQATQQLQNGCRELIKMLIGEEKANELKKMKESGSTKDQLHDKVKEFIGQITDEHKKQIAKEYEEPCHKVFDVPMHSRKRRDDKKPILEKYFKTHLSWLSEDQKVAINKLDDEGKDFNALQDKVFEFYNALSSEDQEKAKAQMQNGCRYGQNSF